MKNTRMIQAWDAVSPTDSQKQNMRAALEAKLIELEKQERPAATAEDLPDLSIRDKLFPAKGLKTTGKGRKRPYTFYRPTKHRGSGLSLAAAMLAMVITCGLFIRVMKRDANVSHSYVMPEVVASATEETRIHAMADAYQKILDQYRSAILENWEPVQCVEQGICYLVKDVDSLDALGYALRDLDEDGTQELIITDGELIYELYTLTAQGETVRMTQSTERDRAYLSKANVIATVGSSSAARTDYGFFKLEDARLRILDRIVYNAGADQPWFRGAAEASITEAEANAVLDSFPHLYIPHTTLSGTPPMTGATLPDEETLKEYARQLSPLVSGVTKENYQLYCFLDWDGDGEEELLVGAGGSVYASLEADREKTEGQPVRFNASGAAYPCENHVMECISHAQGNTLLTYRKYGPEAGGAIQDYLFTDGETWYRMDENDNSLAISENEAQAIRSRYQRLNLPWKSLAEFPVSIPESGEAQALLEEVFLPIAASGEKPTEAELKAKAEEKGFQWIVSGGQILCYPFDSGGASIRANLGAEDGELGEELVFFQPGTIDRWVAVCWEADGTHYLTGIGNVLNGVPAGTVEELQTFLNADEDAIALRETAEGFARAYFARNAKGMQEQTAAGVTIGEGQMYYEAEDRQLLMLLVPEDVEKEYEEKGYVQVSAEVLDDAQSYEFLEMEIGKEKDQWKVQTWFLQK